MALVEKFHVVAAERLVATGESIDEGMVVSLNTSGYVVKQSPSGGFTTPYGIAGDTKSTIASSMPGVYSGWQNRVSDYYDETSASDKMTVYHSGGEFATDQFSSNVSAATPMTALYANEGLLCLVAESAASGIVAYLTQAAAAYPSGVPGVDTAAGINGDMALRGDNTNTYIEFKLVI
jgi:hypothetical protein